MVAIVGRGGSSGEVVAILGRGGSSGEVVAILGRGGSSGEVVVLALVITLGSVNYEKKTSVTSMMCRINYPECTSDVCMPSFVSLDHQI